MNANDNQMEIQVLQPEIDSQIKQVTLGELKIWITDGKLQPNHKVRIKNLSWLEADKIPAFKNLFEAKKNSPEPKAGFEEKRSAPQILSSAVQSQSIFSPPVPKAFKTETVKISTAAIVAPSQKASLSISELLSRGKQDIGEAKTKTEAPEPSIAFKKFEEKRAQRAEQKAADKAKESEPKIEEKSAQAEAKSTDKSQKAETKQAESKQAESKTSGKAKQAEPKAKPAQTTTSKAYRKTSYVKQAVVFLIGTVFVGMLAFGGSYLWVYQLKTPLEINEKVLPELSSLEDKLTSDKLELRVKAAAIDQKIKESKKNDPPIEQIDVAQEIAKLDSQYNIQRKTLIENYRTKLNEDNLYSTFYLSFAVLMVLFLLNRVFYGKTEQVVESAHSSKSPNLQKAPASVVQSADSEASKNINTTDPGRSAHLTNPSDKTEISDEIIQLSDEVISTAEGFDTAIPQKINNCLQHKKTEAKFYCDGCSNYFCEECPKTFEEKENCCPFCQSVCRSANEIVSQATSTPPSAKDSKKKTPVNLLDIGKDSNFTMYEYKDERTRKLGIIPAFVISLLLSGALSILWVYKLAPYLENRGKEIAQNVAPNEAPKSEKGSATASPNQATSENAGNANNGNANTSQNANQSSATVNGQSNANAAAKDPNYDICMDPETKREFKCSEEQNEQLREALRDHARVVKSAQKAQKEVKQKTNLIMSLFSSEAREEVAKENQQNAKPDPEAEARKERDKQLLIKVFAGSFMVIFGLLLSTRLFYKDPNLS